MTHQQSEGDKVGMFLDVLEQAGLLAKFVAFRNQSTVQFIELYGKKIPVNLVGIDTYLEWQRLESLPQLQSADLEFCDYEEVTA